MATEVAKAPAWMQGNGRDTDPLSVSHLGVQAAGQGLGLAGEYGG